MPLYICNAKPGLIDQATSHQIAKDITRIHCEITGAPPEFVHAFFFEESETRPLNGESVMLLGSIRSGRTDEQKAQLVHQLTEAIRERSGICDDKIVVVTADTPANWVMEGGEIFPEPGEEAEWLARYNAKIAAEKSE